MLQVVWTNAHAGPREYLPSSWAWENAALGYKANILFLIPIKLLGVWPVIICIKNILGRRYPLQK